MIRERHQLRLQMRGICLTLVGSVAISLMPGCGTIHVTSDPPGAMVFDTRVYPPGTPHLEGKTNDILIVGFTPCSYTKEAQIPAVKVRWHDGAESQWFYGPRDKLGSQDVHVHFDKSKATIPATHTETWFPVTGPTGYVEFYNGSSRPPVPLMIYQTYGTEECLVGQTAQDRTLGKGNINAVKASRDRLRVPCQPGDNAFAIGLGGDGRVRVSVNVRANTVTPVRIDCMKFSTDTTNSASGPGPGGLVGLRSGSAVIEMFNRFWVNAVIESQQPLAFR